MMSRRRAVIWGPVLMAWLVPGVASAQIPERTRAVVAAGASEPLAGLKKRGDAVVLSDEQRTTRWAHAQAKAKIRTAPRTSSGAVGRLRYLTEDGVAEVYLVLDGVVDRSGRRWLHIRVPKRPNGRTGWVPESSLGRLHTVRTRLIVDRRALRASLYRNGKRIWNAGIGIGKSATPTPSGNFWIRERLRGLGDSTAYGPWAFGTSAYSNLSDWPGGGVVGIHGTNQPGLIPGRPSHGCVRVRNDKIRLLARLMPVGTPVRITS
jgi:hypothetical protein